MKLELLIVMIVLLVGGGCNEAQQSPPKIYGQGELPADYQSLFGNDNIARLSFVHTQWINKQVQDVNELATRVRALEMENPAELAERVRKLEEKNK